MDFVGLIAVVAAGLAAFGLVAFFVVRAIWVPRLHGVKRENLSRKVTRAGLLFCGVVIAFLMALLMLPFFVPGHWLGTLAGRYIGLIALFVLVWLIGRLLEVRGIVLIERSPGGVSPNNSLQRTP